MPMPLAAAARAESRRSQPQPPVVRFLSRAVRAPACFRSRPGAACCRANLSHGGAAGCRNMAIRPDCRRLRSAIADHLAATRGIVADPGRIVIVSGIQEGINIAARLFLDPGTPSAIEDPCYQGAAFAFEATGAEIASVAGRSRRPDSGRAAAAPAALLYLTPSHQYPTGHTLSLRAAPRHRRLGAALRLLHPRRRLRLRFSLRGLAAAGDRRAWRPIARSISAPSRNRSAPDCGSATWSCPRSSPSAVRAAKALLNNGNPWLEQAALAEMMRSGSYAAHLHAHPARTTRRAATACWRRCAAISAMSRERRGGRPASVLASAAGRAGCRHAGGARAPRAGRRLFACLRRCPCGAQPRADAARAHPRLCRADAEADRAGHRAPVRRDRRRRSTIRAPTSTRLLSARPCHRRAPRQTARRPRNLAPNFVSNRLYGAAAAARALLSARARRDKRATSCPSSASIYRYPIKGLSAAAAVERRARGRTSRFPHDRVFALARPGAPIDPRATEMGQEGPVRDADAGRGSGAGRNPSRRRHAAPHDHAGQPAAARRRSQRRGRIAPRSRSFSGNRWFRPCAAPPRWCARAAGISWTSPTMSFR